MKPLQVSSSQLRSGITTNRILAKASVGGKQLHLIIDEAAVIRYCGSYHAAWECSHSLYSLSHGTDCRVVVVH